MSFEDKDDKSYRKVVDGLRGVLLGADARIRHKWKAHEMALQVEGNVEAFLHEGRASLT